MNSAASGAEKVPGHGQCLIFLSFIPVFLKLKILNSYGKGLLLLV